MREVSRPDVGLFTGTWIMGVKVGEEMNLGGGAKDLPSQNEEKNMVSVSFTRK